MDFLFNIVPMLLLMGSRCSVSCLELDRYHDYLSLSSKLSSLSSAFPTLTRLYTLNEKSVEQRDLQVLQIGAGAKGRPLLVPMVKYVANMHGNEVIGRELMLALAEHLLTQYEKGDERIVRLLNFTDIHIMPTMNPDGFERSSIGECRGYDHQSGRTNHHGVDLNRDFPTWDDLQASNWSLYSNRAPETRALMAWITSEPFVLSINFHDGAVVANYPFDDSDAPSGQVSSTPDNELFVALAKLYASKHSNMHVGHSLCDNDNFEQGITNGAEWYVVQGGMQDFNYLFSNCFEITVELSCCKYPLVDDIQLQWQYNKESLISYLEVANSMAIKGLVKDASGQVVANAIVEVEDIEKTVRSSDRGEYWRLLKPGKRHRIRARDGTTRSSKWHQIVVDLDPSKNFPSMRLDLVLHSVVDTRSSLESPSESPSVLSVMTMTTTTITTTTSSSSSSSILSPFSPSSMKLCDLYLLSLCSGMAHLFGH